MYLGINTHFIMKFDFEDGLQFAQDLGLKGMEVAAGGQAAKEYCDLHVRHDTVALPLPIVRPDCPTIVVLEPSGYTPTM